MRPTRILTAGPHRHKGKAAHLDAAEDKLTHSKAPRFIMLIGLQSLVVSSVLLEQPASWFLHAMHTSMIAISSAEGIFGLTNQSLPTGM